MSTSQQLRIRGAATWEAAVTHPMVTELGNGTLPNETFRYYFSQNVLYLEEYARALALIVARTDSRDALRVLARFLQQIVEVELPANDDFLKRLGGPPATGGAAAMSPTAYAYTRHLLDTAGRGDLATGLAAVLPCQWSYGEIGVRLASTPPDNPLYAEWISLFAADGYDDLVQASTSLLDRYSDPASAAQVESLATVFDRSTRYELAFWDMAYSRGTRG